MWRLPSADDKRIWFPVKRYGWGWGLPVKWQGWAAFAIYFGALTAGIWIFSPQASPWAYYGYIVAVTAALVAVAWLKGEPLRWGD